MSAMRRPAVLFDLDGTLLDSIELILNSARYAFEGRAGHVPSDAEWLTGLGIPLPVMFRRYARDEAEVDALIARYREYQLPNHDRLIRAYDGVVDVVQSLHAAGYPLGVVTSKTEALAHRGVDLIGIGHCFGANAVIGYDSGARPKPNPDPVLLALERLGRSPAEGFFVGDSVHDIEAGNAAGVATVAALWGPFSREDLAASRPRHYLERIADLPALLTP